MRASRSASALLHPQLIPRRPACGAALFRFELEEGGLVELVKGKRFYGNDGELVPAYQPFAASMGAQAVPGRQMEVHMDDALYLLLGRRERPTAVELKYSADEYDSFIARTSRLRLQPDVYKQQLERRYAQLLAGDSGGDLVPPPLEAQLPRAAQQHVNQIVTALHKLPETVWMCTVCSCPTTAFYGAGRFYCCYSCARRDEHAFLVESLVASDANFAMYVTKSIKDQLANDKNAHVVQLTSCLHHVELLSGSLRLPGTTTLSLPGMGNFAARIDQNRKAIESTCDRVYLRPILDCHFKYEARLMAIQAQVKAQQLEPPALP